MNRAEIVPCRSRSAATVDGWTFLIIRTRAKSPLRVESGARVIRLEIPVSRWSLDHAGLYRKVGAGVLLAALGILAFHFSRRRSAA